MSNMLDYIVWRGDLPLDRDGWNDVDALVMACFCYGTLTEALDKPLSALEGVSAAPRQGSMEHEVAKLIQAMAVSRRYGGLTVRDWVDVVDPAQNMQFSATTIDAPDGVRVVAFRGTDGTLTGWHEDFNMAFETPVPAQVAAVDYLERAASGFDGTLMLTGHSKGGNLSLYAAAHVSEAAQRRIGVIYTFDGPGLDEASANSDGYRRISGRIRSFVPQSSVVGVLLTYYPDYVVVRSDASGLQQHNAFSWQVAGPRFVTVGELARGSQMVDRTIREWLRICTPEQREKLVAALFDVLKSTNAWSLNDLKRNFVSNTSAVIEAVRRLDPETGKVFAELLGKLMLAGAGSLLRPDKPAPPADTPR